MTNQELTSVWTLQETTAFEDALERRKLRQREAAPAYRTAHIEQGPTNASAPEGDISEKSQQSGGLLIRIIAMAVAAVALAAVATFGLVG